MEGASSQSPGSAGSVDSLTTHTHGKFGGRRRRFLLACARIVLLIIVIVAVITSSVLIWHVSLRTEAEALEKLSVQVREEVFFSCSSHIKSLLRLLTVASLTTYQCMETTSNFTRQALTTNLLSCMWNIKSVYTESLSIYMVNEEGAMVIYRHLGPEGVLLNTSIAVGIPAPADDPHAFLYWYVPDLETGAPLTDGRFLKVCTFGVNCPPVMDPTVYMTPLPSMLRHPLWLAGLTLGNGQTSLVTSMAFSGIWEPTIYQATAFKDPVTNKLLAVMTIAYQASRIKEDWLRLSLVVKMAGVIFITSGPQLHILSSSRGAVALPPLPGAIQARPLPATQSDDEIVKFVARHINDTVGVDNCVSFMGTQAHLRNHGSFYIDCQLLSYSGLSLTLILAVPVKAFKSSIEEARTTSIKWMVVIMVIFFSVGTIGILGPTAFISRVMRAITQQNEELKQQLQTLTLPESNHGSWGGLDMQSGLEKLHAQITRLQSGQTLTDEDVKQIHQSAASITADDLHLPGFLRTTQDKKLVGSQLDSETSSWLAQLASYHAASLDDRSSQSSFVPGPSRPDGMGASSWIEMGSPLSRVYDDEEAFTLLEELQAVVELLGMTSVQVTVSECRSIAMGPGVPEVDTNRSRVPGTRPTLPRNSWSPRDEMARLLGNLGSLELDTLELARITDGRPVLFTGYTAFTRLGLLSKFRIPGDKFVRFLTRMDGGMRPDALYHCGAHIADVTSFLLHLLTESGVGQYLGPKDYLAGMCAALVHDYKHPGYNNDFIKNTSGELAILYNDNSILENFHLSEAFRVLLEDEHNFLKHLGRPVNAEIRQIIIEMVLATDLKRHFKLVDTFRSRLMSLSEKPWDPDSESDRLILLRMAIKVADLGHVCKPLALHCQWTDLILEEFYLQGDAERKANMEVSPFMDRRNNCVPKTQSGFFHFVVLPLFEAWVKAFPRSSPLLTNLQANAEFWKTQMKKLET